jgi:hypothetical protein
MSDAEMAGLFHQHPRSGEFVVSMTPKGPHIDRADEFIVISAELVAQWIEGRGLPFYRLATAGDADANGVLTAVTLTGTNREVTYRLHRLDCGCYTGRLVPATAAEFEAGYAKRSGVTVGWLRAQGMRAERCDCGDATCHGWQMVRPSATQAAYQLTVPSAITDGGKTVENRPAEDPVSGVRGRRLRQLTAPTYHDLYVTTADIKRARIFDLPYGLDVRCCRVAGWQLWNMNTPEPVCLAGEFDGADKWLVLDVAGHVIVDSRNREGDDDGEHREAAEDHRTGAAGTAGGDSPSADAQRAAGGGSGRPCGA